MNSLRDVVRDLRYSARILARSSSFTIIALLIFAIGIGANTAIFSVVDAVFLRKMPYEEPSRIVELSESRRARSVPPGDFLEWEKQTLSFREIAATDVLEQYTLTGLGAPAQLWGTAVSANFFHLLGAHATVGRTFLPDETQAAVLSDHCWRTCFSSASHILGRSIMLEGKQYAIVGVMPSDFYFGTDITDVWIPLTPTPEDASNHVEPLLSVFGRLKNRTTLGQAQAEMTTIQSRITGTFGKAVRHVTLAPLKAPSLGSFRPAVFSLIGAVVFTLLIGCANVASMSLTRGAERQREMAIRSALGASRLRLARQLLTESLAVSVLGGAAGLLLAVAGLRTILALVPNNDFATFGTLNRATINLAVLGFAFGLSLITGVIVGVLPAWKSSRLDLVESLKEGAPGIGASVRKVETQSLLVVLEIALSLILLVGAGLMVESFHRLATVPLGFDPDHALTLQLLASSYDFRKASEPAVFYQTIIDRIRAIPGVEAVGMTNDSPLSPLGAHLTLAVSGASWAGSPSPIHIDFQDVSSQYFLAMGMHLHGGRYFTAEDSKNGPPVAIINESMAHRYWSTRDPIGHRLYGDVTIVGITSDTVQRSLSQMPEPMIYRPFDQQPVSAAATDFIIRTKGDPLRIASAVRSAISDISPNQAVVRMRTMSSAVADSIWRPRLSATMLAILALIALFLTAAGVYGVMSHSISKRTHEIGIRIALGAQHRDILRMVFADGLRLAVVGVALGFAGSLVATRLIAGMLFDIKPEDPATLLGAMFVISAVALAACYVPLRRAIRVDPIVALRYE